jgi:hypothetical protein
VGARAGVSREVEPLASVYVAVVSGLNVVVDSVVEPEDSPVAVESVLDVPVSP